MTQGSDHQAGAGAPSSSWSGGADADSSTPAGGAGAGAAGALTLGSILTVAGILLLFIVFAFGLVALQYCFNAFDRDLPSGLRGSRRRRGGSGRVSAVRATRGVDPDLLRSLPVTVYRTAPEKAGDAVECAVCLAELEDGEEARFLPRCGHGFHAECVDMWLASHTTCPLCRLTVAKPDAASLPAVQPEPANYYAAGGGLLPASVLLGVSDQHGAVAMATEEAPSSEPSSAGATTPVLVVDIPEPTPPTPRDTVKSPASATLRSIRRLWSFGRQGAPGPSSSCTCAAAGASEEADLEKGITVTIGIAIGEVPPLPMERLWSGRHAEPPHSIAPDRT